MTPPPPKDRTEALARDYTAALATFLERSDESSRSHAYELGRRAMVDGLGLLDMAELHRAAVKALVHSAVADERTRRADAAADFFYELLSPFEMSYRGYRAANDELVRLNETLRRQKESLENINHELESFSYSVSHDLRAPLRAIEGFSQILAEDCSDAIGAEGQESLRHIRQATKHMGKLIEDLLGLARVTRTELHRVDVDLSAVARRVRDRLVAAAPGRSVHFEIQEGVRGWGDERLIEVLLENLIGNAWKFTSKRERAEIGFGCADHAGNRTYFVRDNGAGFDMSYARKLFGAFQRLHSASEFEGTGIGLATVQRIVHRHGGRVWAEAKVGAGAEFHFTLGGGE